MYKLQGLYQDERDESLREFDGYTIEDVEKDTFQRRKERLKNKLNKLVKHFKSNAPEPIKGGGASTEQIDIKDDGIENPIILKWYKRYSSLGGKKYFQFHKKDLQEAQEKLKEIARYRIQLNAIDEVSDVASLEGRYKFFKTFDSVPDACRHYAEELGEEGLTREALKRNIKRYAYIKEDGSKLDHWPTINRRVNAWVDHESNKPNKKEIPPV